MPHHSKHSVQHRQSSHQSFITDEPCNGQRLGAPIATESYTIGLHPNANWTPPNSSSSGEEAGDHEYRRSPYDVVPSSPQDVVGVGNRISHNQEQSGDKNDKRVVVGKDSSQAIATVLLLAAAASSEKELTLATHGDVEKYHESGSFDSSSSGSRPLKKRRNTDSIDAAHSFEGKATADRTCHVSPISHSSKSGMSSDPRALSHDTPSTSSAHSFDMKDDGAAKSRNENRYAPSQRNAYAMIPQFPSLLHWLLSDVPSLKSQAFDPSVLQWVPHGQAWRIVRWDFFHRNVLPAAFPQLALETNGMVGSIDAFLWQLKAWGFEEIKDGPDVGAFAHTLFRRGHPLLCEDMKFAPIGTTSFADSRSILRVPSLASTNNTTVNRSKNGSELVDGDFASTSDNQDGLVRSISATRMIVDYTGSPLRQYSVGLHNSKAVLPFGQRKGPPAYVNYSPEELNLTANGWKLSSSSKPRGPWTNPCTAGARQNTDNEGGQIGSPYSPLRIRSTRGARRHSLNSVSACNSSTSVRSSPTDETMLSRSRGFPVSNRGKGRRTVVANPATSRNFESYSAGEIVMLSDVNTSSGAVSDHSLSTNTDIKYPRSVLKRKLPMAANSDVSC